MPRLHSLKLRFMLIVISGATLFAMAAAAVAYRLGHERALDSGRATLASLADTVEKTAAIGAFTADKVLLREVLAGLARNPLVAATEVLAPDQSVLVRLQASDRPVGAGGVAIERSLASPFEAGEAVGLLRIEADRGRLEANARSEASTFALLMVAQTALLAVLLYSVAERFVSRPIVRLAKDLQSMTPGTSKRLEVPSRHETDEIGALIGSANALLQGNESALSRERQLRAEVEKIQAQYRQIFDSSSAGIFVLDAEGQLINSNPTAVRVIGLPVSDMQRWRGDEFVNQVFLRPEHARALMQQAMHSRATVSADLELRQNGSAPCWVHCLISVQGAATPHPLFEGVIYDITERRQAESAVRHRAEHDSLTGLKNRAAAEAALDQYIADAASAGSAVTVLYVDLDGFKRVNDDLGHKAGDQVLWQCAQRLLAAVRRSSDLVARMGGDEFIIGLRDTRCEDALAVKVAVGLLARLCEPITLDDGAVVRVGASLGLASYPRHAASRKALLHAADAAMYEVKRTGKNSYAMAMATAPP